jgi:hypothetical protein
MTENNNENITEEVQDVEGHRVRHPGPGGLVEDEDEDVEGHRVRHPGPGGLVEDGIDFERPR